jgi:hypothetical protein
MHVMMRQIMALFDEYQSKENAKHVMRALKENARQGFWNGSLPPVGYRIVAAGQRGAKTKKKLEIDPLHAETVRLIYRLALHGDRPAPSYRPDPLRQCGGAMTIRTGKGGRYRYYACSTKARQGPTACEGLAVPMDKLDDLVVLWRTAA